MKNTHDWICETSVDSKNFSVSVEIIFNSYLTVVYSPIELDLLPTDD